MRALPLALTALALVAVVPAPAVACCHVYEYEREAGPCLVRWEGDLFGGLRTERVIVRCGDHGTSVENPVPGPREGGFPWDALP